MAMFEIGKIYKITTWADGGAKASSWTVIEHDWPLIKVAGAEVEETGGHQHDVLRVRERRARKPMTSARRLLIG